MQNVVVKAAPDSTIQDVITAAVSKLSYSLRIYKRDLAASQVSLTGSSTLIRDLPEVAYDAFRRGEQLDAQRTIGELGFHANDTIQLIPQLVKQLVYSS